MLVLFLALGMSSVADAGPWWNPFAAKDKPSTNPNYAPGKMVIDGKPINGSSVQAPKSMPAVAVEKVGQGTKSLLTSTKNALTFKKKPSNPEPSWSRTPPTQKKPQKPKSGMFGSWFRPKEPEGPRTVEEFLQSPRP